MYESTEKLEKELLACVACPLAQAGNRGATSWNGDVAAQLAIVGEGPGQVEDEYGVPLVGPSGQLLDKALHSVGVTRDRIYTTNVIKCRPKGNRTPTLEESCFCALRWLDEEMACVKPKVIIALGSVALKYLKGEEARITRDRGNWFETKYGIPAIATYHPAYLLRQSGKELVKAKWQVYYDFQAAVERVASLVPECKLKSEEAPKLLEIYTERRAARCK